MMDWVLSTGVAFVKTGCEILCKTHFIYSTFKHEKNNYHAGHEFQRHVYIYGGGKFIFSEVLFQ